MAEVVRAQGEGTARAPGEPRLSALARSIILTFFAVAATLALLRLVGLQLNGDLDDLLKLLEVRHLIATGDIFDRTLPGILQPEPYVTHWPWIVDLPYAALAALLTPLMGADAALKAACLAVPLLLLAPAVFAYSRLVAVLGFAVPAVALPLATLFAMRGFFEFAPGRIDYHNLQILLCLTTLVLSISKARMAPLAGGMLAALALAISLEFAAFYALIVAVHAFDFVFGRQDGARRLTLFGIGMATAGLALFALIVPPTNYLTMRCDAYALPQGLALTAGGLALAVAPMLAQRGGWAVRAATLVGMATAIGTALAFLFPDCLGGPYGALSGYVRATFLAQIDQEKSLFARPDFVLSGNFAGMAVLFCGALVPLVLSMADRGRDRALAIVALASLVALLEAIAYFRYFRYLPLFSGIGLVLALGSFLPAGSRAAALVRSRFDGTASRAALILPGLVLAASLGLFHLVWRVPPDRITAAYVADSCDLDQMSRQSWPANTRLMAPPKIGLQLLAGSALSVVATPHHPAWRGIERAYRFLDPATADPRAMLDAAQATHVAVCAWRDTPVPELGQLYSFAAALIEGRPPAWLSQCPTAGSSPIRIYAYRNADGSVPACPLPATTVQGTTISMR